jgi:predicted anti-sigma-YlaC factor YlaD
MTVRALAVLALIAPIGAWGCSVKRVALKGLADTLAAAGDTFSSDEDPELIRDAVPFSLKTMESVLAELPNHRGLLLATCSGFTQYAYAFIQTDADLVEPDDFERARALRIRARRMFLRARGYCLRHLELRHAGLGTRLVTDPAGAVAGAGRDEVPALYWTGASWGSAIALGLDQPALIADLPAVRAIFDRALALDEAYDRGALHAALISIAASPVMGGSPDRARRHFARAVELSNGRSAGPYVALAASVSVAEQNRQEFERLLHAALAIDVNEEASLRLANVIAQARARHLLSRAGDLFVDDEPSPAARGPDMVLPALVRTIVFPRRPAGSTR